uniref:ATP synthase subunit a n=1 Tax=Fieberiella septentrionalis TaxID=1978376 RepID=A0A890CB70_9HEMI|nr:ATP synthase F0 subunit 6 [Fieberiella septentrionalis]QRG29280.1 ATP synthase F0 subunit 6 [Fieberiella septentrionalis]
MMMNLFSTFDPCTGYLSLNWLSMLLPFLLPLNMWNMFGKYNLMNKIIQIKLHKEMSMLLKSKGMSIIMITMFMIIMINNMMGLMPYVFTSTAHLVVSLSMALTIWMGIMLFGWIEKTNNMFCHLVPTGTPSVLMPFMVLIETISNFIRPGSLAVRLSANMIAGHLLMTLLGNSLQNYMMMIMIWSLMILMLFELAVAMIQAYVFMTLSTLYSSEI